MVALRSITTVSLASLLLLAACGDDGGGGGDAGPSIDAGPLDSDGDGIPDDDERQNGTDPNDPDSDDDGLNDSDERRYGTDPNNGDSDGDGLNDGDEVELGTNPTQPGCENQNAVATPGKVPADIILVIDTSTSMVEEADAVEANINDDLAGVLEGDSIDYRIIMLADFPPADGRSQDGEVDPTDPTLCIGPPLTTQNCANLGTQRKPNNGDPATSRFFHYDLHVDSHDALQLIVSEFDDPSGDNGTTSGAAQYPGGWGQLLRPDSVKIFIVISDDEATGIDVTQFGQQFTAKVDARFPEATQELRYIVHSILGMAGKPDGTPWQPGDPVQDRLCEPNAEDFGRTHQELSIATGGLRFPLCNVNDDDPSNDDFNAIFNAIATEVGNQVSLPCTFTPSAAQADLELDNAKIAYRPMGMGGIEAFKSVPSLDDCADATDAFYRRSEGDQVFFELCPATCSRVTADPTGEISLVIDCTVPIPE
jgi:hypothetical protein